MTVRCPNCGRAYDESLFRFGRTITCACGERVGLEAKIDLPANGELKFFADVMHGRLARWLRALNIDTVWEHKIPDAELVRRALAEKRFILTRDKRLPVEHRVDNVLLIASQEPFEQFRQTVGHFKIEKPPELFLRCLVCNTVLRAATQEEIAANVLPQVQAEQRDFRFCARCKRIYWTGSHAVRMRQQIETIFKK